MVLQIGLVADISTRPTDARTELYFYTTVDYHQHCTSCIIIKIFVNYIFAAVSGPIGIVDHINFVVTGLINFLINLTIL